MSEKKQDLTVVVNGLVDIHTERRMAPVIPTPLIPDQEDIVTYVRKNKVKKVGNTGNEDEDYIVQEVVVEDSRVNRQAFIDKDALEVGVLNILEKVRRSGDMTLLDQTGYRCAEASGEVDSLGRPMAAIQDFTNAPHSVQEVLDGMKKGAESYEALKSILGGSFEDVAKMSADDITAKLTAYVQELNKANADKGGEK